MTHQNFPERNEAPEMLQTNIHAVSNPDSLSTGPMSKTRTGLKMLLIAGICITFLIPQVLIRRTVDERQLTRDEAQQELSKSWGREQHVSGPVIIIPGHQSTTPDIVLCPNDLKIQSTVKTQSLKRGIFHFNVYSVPITMTGNFNYPEKLAKKDLSSHDLSKAYLLMDISDLRGLTGNVKIKWGGKALVVESVSSNTNIDGLTVPIDLYQLRDNGEIAFNISIPLKGSNGLYFTPVGNTNTITLNSDYGSPSFQGNFLPVERKISNDGFAAQWSVLSLNRTFGQVFTLTEHLEYITDKAESGVDFCIPVDQYQQTTRAVKYTLLVVALTFAVVFFVEIRKRTRIHPIQYVLIGFAIVLFYTLLLSLSEHITFLTSYIIAAIVTIGCITIYLSAIIKNRKTALAIGGGLALLYAFIFVLLQLENYALLVGSIGLFCILGAAMYASQKIKWYGEK